MKEKMTWKNCVLLICGFIVLGGIGSFKISNTFNQQLGSAIFAMMGVTITLLIMSAGKNGKEYRKIPKVLIGALVMMLLTTSTYLLRLIFKI